VKKITIRADGKRWKLPEVLSFGNYEIINNYFFYKAIGFRCPKKGEYFISGAKPRAYKAPNDLNTKYLIIEKTAKGKREEIWTAVLE